MTATRPSTQAEQSLVEEGFDIIVGLDEVGRGAWAGPVTVGAALFHMAVPPPVGLRDSKLVPEHHREALFPLVAAWCMDWSVGHAGPDECDQWGMTIALRLAAQRALAGLSCIPDVVLVDGGFDYVTEPGNDDVATVRTPKIPAAGRGGGTRTSNGRA